MADGTRTAPRRWDRGMLVGSSICAFFGATWSLWAAGGLSGTSAVGCRVVGVLVAVIVVVANLVRARHPRTGSSGTALVSRRYWLVNLIEVVLIVGGAALLARSGRPEAMIIWTSAVVGAHFLVFGRWFWRGFVLLGVWLLLGAAVGVVVVILQPSAAVATTGVIAAAALLTFAILMPYGGRGRQPGVDRSP